MDPTNFIWPTPVIKVFINWVDTYTCYNISRHLVLCHSSGPSVAADEEADNNSLSICYEIYGTVRSHDTNKSLSHVRKIISRFNQMELVEWLNNCDVIIFDITEDPEQIEEAKWALHVLEDNIKNETGVKMFILLSTVMTWLRTPIPQAVKEADEEEEDALLTGPIPFTEDDYRRRKAHPNYKKHLLLEKEVTRVGRIKPETFKTCVIAAGLKYGKGEDLLLYYFKKAWLNASSLTCIGSGKNIIPLTYVTDLVLVVKSLVEKNEVSPMYVLAVDGTSTDMESIVKAISEKLTTGAVRKLSLENALLIDDLKTLHLDHFMCDLRMESTFISYLTFEGGLVPHISELIEEFKEVHGLQPIRIFVHGPPGAGQKELVEEICAFYKLHPVFVTAVINEKILSLKKLANMHMESEPDTAGDVVGEEEEEVEEQTEETETVVDDDQSEKGGEEEEEDDDDALSQKILEAQEFLTILKESQERNKGRIEDKYILQIVREKLFSKPCQNQGFVLCDYPETLQQAKELFALPPDLPDDEFNAVIMPEIVITLDAPDEYLKSKLIMLPEIELIEEYGSEEALIHKLMEFRILNTDENTVLNYFDEREIRVEIVELTTIESNKSIMERIKRIIGQPRNFGLSPEEIEKEFKLKVEIKLREQLEAKLKAEEEERQESIQRAELLREWQLKLVEVHLQEEQLLEAESLPMRNYLMQHVLPVLSKGLLECIKIRPGDPINFLAEFLFKYTPAKFPTPGKKSI